MWIRPSAAASARVALRRLGYRIAYRLLQILWLIVPRPRRGVKCVLTDGAQVLLVRHTYGRRSWDLPGGNLRRGERPLAAARREMREELGVDRADWMAIGDLHGLARNPCDAHDSRIARHRCDTRRARDTVHCFHAELDAPPLALDAGEIAAARWFPRDQLPHDLGPYVRPVLAKASAAISGRG